MTKMKKKQNKEELAPKYIKEGEEGLENVTGKDLVIPRLVIMQALTPSVEEGNNEKGQVLNSLTQEVWLEPDEEAEFIPIYHMKEWIQWASRDSGQGILDRSSDPNSELAMMSARGEKNDEGKFIVTEYHNFICVFRSQGFSKPVILPCCRSNHKHGRKLLGLAKYRGTYPLYAGLYTLSPVKETNKQSQSYYAWSIENAGWVGEDELAEAEKMYQVISSMKWQDAGPVEDAPEDDGEI